MCFKSCFGFTCVSGTINTRYRCSGLGLVSPYYLYAVLTSQGFSSLSVYAVLNFELSVTQSIDQSVTERTIATIFNERFTTPRHNVPFALNDLGSFLNHAIAAGLVLLVRP